MNINFIWIGEVVPPPFIDNYKTCARLNPHHTVRLFRDHDLDSLAKEFGIFDIYKKINLVNRVNLAKYLTLHYFPGLYSDIDIIWHKPVDELLRQPVNRFYDGCLWPNFNKIHKNPEFISCVRPYLHVYKGEKVYIFDDHLVYATTDGIWKAIKYMQGKWLNKKFNPLIQFEPFGPVSITEMVYDNNLKANMWFDPQCQAKGQFCTHTSMRLWDGIPM